MFDLHRRPEVVRWLGVEPQVMTDRSEAAERIAAWAAYAEEHPGYGRWAAEVTETGVPAAGRAGRSRRPATKTSDTKPGVSS